MTTLYLHNLGCSKNQVDGEAFAGWAALQGIELIDAAEEAEIIVINTCAFIDAAKDEAIDAILAAGQLKETARCQRLYVCGCFPQRFKEELQAELPAVDGFYGVQEWSDLQNQLKPETTAAADPLLHRIIGTPGHYAYLRIADGCNRGCTYCVIPQIRGKYHSRPPENIIWEAQLLAANGVKELLPVAQELNSYGHDLNAGHKNKPLIDLLGRLGQIDGIEWIRPLYLHPPACDEELLIFWASQPKLCPYLDLPIEHASDRMLRAMGRGGSQKQLRQLLETARSLIPGVVIRTSMIVGFPGETDADFEELLSFVAAMEIARLGSFQYSPEDGTPAALLPDQIPDEVKAERQTRLMELQADISEERCLARVGQVAEVFVDFYEKETGYSIAHSRLELPDLDGEILIQGELQAGSKLKVRFTSATEYDLFAEIVDA
ncbi:30S ribosomal protein S12 methylthiotransferase RimO [bacterium]|nr:30S ribosomal protein S12 methylthiotransferase RimO [bacterium]MBU1652303.1 30S ribosomal protein S12 methylthiotransferase RimO [bacterium]MBU1880712.1 30S ribosomal protein S12 methylthiotransferase RimO [bacterium]